MMASLTFSLELMELLVWQEQAEQAGPMWSMALLAATTLPSTLLQLLVYPLIKALSSMEPVVVINLDKV